MENFKNDIFKKREEINDRMAKMFELLKELTTSRAPEKVLIQEEAKLPVTEIVNSISITRWEEERDDDNDIVTSNDIKKFTRTEMEVSLKEAETKNEAENKTKNRPIKKAEKEEAVEAPSSQPVEYYLKHRINEKLLEGLVDNHRESSPITQVTDTQHVEEPVATTDAIKSVDASESIEELGNQPKPTDVEKVTVNLNIMGTASNQSQTSLGESGEDKGFITHNVDLENSRLYKDQQHPAHESQTSKCLNFTQPQGLLNHNQKSPKGAGSSLLVQEITKADYDLESMPDDEISFVSGFEEADDDDSKIEEELSKNDEVAVNFVLDELVYMANTKDAILNVFTAKKTDSGPFGHLQMDISSLTAKMVVDALKERLLELLADTLKNILLELLIDSVKKAMPNFDK
uniref:Uncharacterized protein n=1 Tax=Tanacetum cinerariifolium TaxID=118510 RepID=A0A6L2LJZ9_TANCI|nr:hypothetical protein [Tanacetum cinerariifolium]